jgi:protein SCO1/2
MRKFLILIFVLIFYNCKQQRLPFYNSPSFTPLWPGEQKFSSDTLHRIAPFQFTDQHGEGVSNKTFQGKIYVANFFFTSCPSICPKMTNHLAKVQHTFSTNDKVMLLSHTVMPWADSVRQLNEFALLHQINYPKWRLVTGKQSEIYALARQSYFAEEVASYSRDSTSFVHTEHCLLVDKNGHLRGLYNGTLELEINRMIDDIRILLKEK